ncbi:MAG TPA: glycosyltransferase family 4 protein [Anaerolineales bacterium]|nr:glycosyltransferase family 4 protein [Anaerolineales bacterium]
MKIAFVTLGFTPYRASGLDLSGERLVKGLLSEGHTITVIAGRRVGVHEVFVNPALEIFRLPLGNTDWIGFGIRTSRLLRRLEAFDIVHFWDVHFGYAYRGKYVASLQHSFRQRVISLGGISNRNTLGWIYRYSYYRLAQYFSEISAIKNASGFLAGSLTSQNEFIENYGIPSEKICLARHGVDVDFFRPSEKVEELRNRLGVTRNEPVILFAGFMTPRKGLEYLAEAMPLIHPKPKLLLVGNWRNQTYRTKIMQLLEPVKKDVIETGFVRDEELPDYYSLADVYVSPSLLEGFGLPIAEALACETPVVAADSGAVAEVAGQGGILIPPRDPQAIAEAVSSLLQDPGLRSALGKQGRANIASELSLTRMVKDTIRAYEHFI